MGMGGLSRAGRGRAGSLGRGCSRNPLGNRALSRVAQGDPRKPLGDDSILPGVAQGWPSDLLGNGDLPGLAQGDLREPLGNGALPWGPLGNGVPYKSSSWKSPWLLPVLCPLPPQD